MLRTTTASLTGSEPNYVANDASSQITLIGNGIVNNNDYGSLTVRNGLNIINGSYINSSKAMFSVHYAALHNYSNVMN